MARLAGQVALFVLLVGATPLEATRPHDEASKAARAKSGDGNPARVGDGLHSEQETFLRLFLGPGNILSEGAAKAPSPEGMARKALKAAAAADDAMLDAEKNARFRTTTLLGDEHYDRDAWESAKLAWFQVRKAWEIACVLWNPSGIKLDEVQMRTSVLFPSEPFCNPSWRAARTFTFMNPAPMSKLLDTQVRDAIRYAINARRDHQHAGAIRVTWAADAHKDDVVRATLTGDTEEAMKMAGFAADVIKSARDVAARYAQAVASAAAAAQSCLEARKTAAGGVAFVANSKATKSADVSIAARGAADVANEAARNSAKVAKEAMTTAAAADRLAIAEASSSGEAGKAANSAVKALESKYVALREAAGAAYEAEEAKSQHSATVRNASAEASELYKTGAAAHSAAEELASEVDAVAKAAEAIGKAVAEA